MELLERGPALAALHSALDEALGGTGRVAAVSGDAGIGKTSLVEAFVAAATDRARVLAGACDDLLAPRALGPLHDIAHRLGGEVGALLDGAAPAERLYRAVVEALRGAPTVLVVEDVHWADEATLDWLAHVGRRLAELPVLLVLTFRDDDPEPMTRIARVLAALPRRVVVRLPLPLLSPQAVAVLAGPRARAVYALTGGSPLLVTELLAGGGTEVPLSIRESVLGRLAAAPPGSRAAIDVVALVPGVTEWWLVEATSGLEAAEAAMRSGLLVADDAGVRFRHELTRRVVEDALFVPRRRALHRQILHGSGGPRKRRPGPPRPPRPVRWRRGGDPAPRRGGGPERRGRPVAPGSRARSSAPRWSTPDCSTSANAPGSWRCLPWRAHLTDRTRESLAAVEEAARLWQALGDRRAAGASLARQAEVQWRSGDQAGGLKAARTAVGILEGLDPGPELAMAYGMVAGLSNMSDAYIEGRAWGERAADLARKLGSDAALAFALVQVGVATADDDPDAGTAMLLAAHRLADGAGRDDVAALALTFRARAWVYRYRADQAEPALAEALAYADAHEVSAYRQYMLALRAQSLADLGRWEAAEQDARAVLSASDQSGIFAAPALLTLGQLQSRRGEEDAGATLEEAWRWALRAGGIQRVGPTAAARVEHAWLTGDRAAARALAADGFRRVAEIGEPWTTGELACWCVQLGIPVALPGPVAEPYAALLGEDWAAAAIYWEKQGRPYRHALALTASARSRRGRPRAGHCRPAGRERTGGPAARAAAGAGHDPSAARPDRRHPRQSRRPHRPPARGARARGRGADQRRDRRPAGGVDPHGRPPRRGRAVPARGRLPPVGAPPRRRTGHPYLGRSPGRDGLKLPMPGQARPTDARWRQPRTHIRSTS